MIRTLDQDTVNEIQLKTIDVFDFIVRSLSVDFRDKYSENIERLSQDFIVTKRSLDLIRYIDKDKLAELLEGVDDSADVRELPWRKIFSSIFSSIEDPHIELYMYSLKQEFPAGKGGHHLL